MRKIVQIKTIDKISPIENADAIEVASIGGWNVVVKKNEFKVNDAVLYFEVDSFLPADVRAFAFLAEKSSRTVINPLNNKEVQGHVLRTVRLRGQISQGLILPLSWGLNSDSTQEDVDAVCSVLGVFKYEPPIPANTRGKIIGKFPTHLIQKTDAERVQNLTDDFLQTLDPNEWVPSEKVDGTSATFIKEDGVLRVCGRNWELDIAGDHLYAEVARQYNLSDILQDGDMVQGEIFGPGIQKNPLNMPHVQLLVFKAEVSSATAQEFVDAHRVPQLGFVLPSTVEESIAQAFDLKSTLNPNKQAEGIVWWHVNGKQFSELDYRANFKAINDKFLLKAKD